MPMSCSRRDLVCGPWAALMWGIPTALILVGALAPSVRAWLWIPSFAVMGIACVVNARGCGRLHCFVTGPLFLIASIATALDVGSRLVLMGAASGTLLAYSLEWLRGKYIGTTVP